MNVGGIGIDRSRIEAMMEQLKAQATKPGAAPSGTGGTGGVNGVGGALGPSAASGVGSATKVDFSDALKAQLEKVSEAQTNASELGKSFAMGDDKVSLSDVMIAGQKASIAFQATVQVRNKLVSAYHEIMNMQV